MTEEQSRLRITKSTKQKESKKKEAPIPAERTIIVKADAKVAFKNRPIMRFRVGRAIWMTILVAIPALVVPLMIYFTVIAGDWLNTFIIDPNAAELIDTLKSQLNGTLMIFNGSLITVIFCVWALADNKTFIRFIMECIILGLLIYCYFIGLNMYTVYLPVQGFAVLSVDISIISISFAIPFLAICILIYQAICAGKSYFEWYNQ